MKGAAKWEYVSKMRDRYQIAGRVEKSLILDELLKNEVAGHRKSAVRLMYATGAKGETSKRGRKVLYNEFVVTHLRKLWIQMGQMCSKRMKAALPKWLPHYEVPEVARIMLLRMAPSTMDRLLQPYRSEWRRRNQTGTRAGYPLIKTMIPIKPFNFNVEVPGYVECDTVAHCGGSLEGLFAWSLTVTDIDSGWTVCRSMWGKSGKGVIDSFVSIEAHLPFAIKMRFVDNGNEFLNHQLLLWLKSQGLEPKDHMKRGRPYRSNDQCHVEQKNFTHVRELFGYERIENKEAIALMNDIYQNEWNLLQNYYCPQVKLIRKTRIGSKYKREHTKPMTPYDRIQASPAIADKKKKELQEIYKTLNPFKLREAIEAKLKVIDALINRKEENNVEAA
ncbi:transposase family protein [bacterium]|nr:transposase family protein [bacterium]